MEIKNPEKNMQPKTVHPHTRRHTEPKDLSKDLYEEANNNSRESKPLVAPLAFTRGH
jgi:hypothetical protein